LSSAAKERKKLQKHHLHRLDIVSMVFRGHHTKEPKVMTAANKKIN
jgi:hypothetical protein